MTEPVQRDTLLEFPAEFPLKIMGPADEALAPNILAVIQRQTKK